MSGVHNATNWLDNPFWQYSIKQYSQPGCASFLLKAQEQQQLDVNILLFIGWVSAQQLLLPNKQLLNRAVFINDFLIRPIRWIRKACKHRAPDRIYQWIKFIELKAEQLEQGVLYSSMKNLKVTQGERLCFERNLNVYMGQRDIEDTWLQTLVEYLQPDMGTD